MNDRHPSDTEPSRLAADHQRKLRVMREAIEQWDALPKVPIDEQRAEYALAHARVLAAGRDLVG